MSTARAWFIATLAPLGMGLAALVLWQIDWLEWLDIDPPPVERVTIERVVLDESGIEASVRTGGSGPVQIAQVQVDGAYWQFSQTPAGPLRPGQVAQIHLPYPWVTGETHHLRFVTSTGITFDHTIDVAQRTPRPSPGMFTGYGLLGVFVGVVPVALGMLFYPLLARSGRRGMDFALALTLGLLAYLLVDTLESALELGSRSAPALQGTVLVWLAAVAAFLGLRAATPAGGRADGLTLAWHIALGIGLHNLGEGLAIGAALSSGEAVLGLFLVLGFALHNVTEGVGIAAPLTGRRVSWLQWPGLVALAGLPAVAGAWIGGLVFAPHWSAVLLGLGVGAIAQVILEVGDFLRRRDPTAGVTPTMLAGFLAGLGVMYATAYLVHM